MPTSYKNQIPYETAVPYRDISLEKHVFDWGACFGCGLGFRFICQRVFEYGEMELLLRKKKVRIYSFGEHNRNHILETLAGLTSNFLRQGKWEALPLIRDGCRLCGCDRDRCVNAKIKTRRQICFCPKLFGLDLDLGESEGALLIDGETP
jgi:hypothetical protein